MITVRRLALAGLAVIAASCEPGLTDSDAGPLQDPQAVYSWAADFAEAIGTPAMHTLLLLSPRMLVTSSNTAAPPGPFASACAPRAPSGPWPLAPNAAPHNPNSLIPAAMYRRVFSYDGPSRAYYHSADSGGPDSGVRFALDAVSDQASLIVPRSSVGALDLSDRSAGGAFAMDAQILNGSASNADFSVAPVGTQSLYHALRTGHIRHGATLLAFRDSIRRDSARLSVTATLDDSARGVQLRLSATRLTYDPADNLYTLDFSFSRGGETIRIAGATDTWCWFGTSEFTIAVNGDTAATFSGDWTTREVTTPAGQPLGQQQRRAVFALVDAQQQLFEWLVAVFEPVWRLMPN